MFQPNQRMTVDLSGLSSRASRSARTCDDPAADVHRPGRLPGRAPVQLQGRQAGGCAGGADPSELTVAERDRIAEFKEVAELMPDDLVVRFGLAGAYLEAGQAESAIIVTGDDPAQA